MILWLVVLVPIVAGLAVPVLRRAGSPVAVGALATTIAVGVVAASTEPAAAMLWGPRLEVTLAATGFARVMVVLVPVIALPIVVYASATETTGRVRSLSLLTAFVGVMELLVLANDLLTLLIAWELVGALSWLLIAHKWRDPDNVRKATHAFITTRFGDLGIYVAAGVAFASTGSFAYSSLAGAPPFELALIAAGILLASAAKSAQVPFSPWLFSAMAGPTPVSALLHSSTMVAAGAYLLVRLGPQLGSVTWFADAVLAIGLTTALGGGLVATVQNHPKRLLAASTSAQYGLMFVAIGAGSTLAAGGQLITHAAFKSLLFLTAGVAIQAARSEDLAEMRLGRRLPRVATFAAIGALALAGVPPLGGAWSKEQIAGAAFEYSTAIGTLLLLAAFLSAAYVGRYWSLAFAPGDAGPREAPEGRVMWSLALLAGASLAASVLWIPAINDRLSDVMSGRILPAHASEIVLGLVAVALGIALILVLRRRGRLAQGPLPRGAGEFASGWFGLGVVSEKVVVAPVLALARFLAAFDERVIDAGIRASAAIAQSVSRLLHRRSELSIDAIVNGLAAGTYALATSSRTLDDEGVDRAVEGLAGGLGRSGELVRKLQTGLTHHYYVIVVAGLLALGAALALGTS